MRWTCWFWLGLVPMVVAAIAPSGVPQSAPGSFAMDDAEGDVWLVSPVSPGAGFPVYEQTDIVKFYAGPEAPDRLEFHMKFKDLLSPTLDAEYQAASLFFKIGAAEFWSHFSIRGAISETPQLERWARVCRRAADSATTIDCFDAVLETRGAGNEFVLWLPRRAMQEQETGRFAVLEIPKGARLDSFKVDSDVQVAGFGGFARDTAPNSGASPTWELASDVPRGPVTFTYGRFGRAFYSDVPLDIHGPTLVPVVVRNDGSGKRLVNISAAFDTADPKWSIRAPQLIAVPPGQSRVFNLVVEPNGVVKHGEVTDLIVQGRMPGFADEGAFLRLRGFAAALPDVERPTLYLHASSSYSYEGCMPRCKYPEYWMNALKDDPRADSTAYFQAPPSSYRYTPQGGGSLAFIGGALDTPRPADLLLRKGVPANVSVDVAVRSEAEIEVRASIMGDFGEYGMGRVTKKVPAGASSMQVAIPIAADRIPANDTRLALVVQFYSSDPAYTANENGFRIGFKDTKIELPVAPPPPDPFAVTKTNVLLLQREGDQDDLVNPGEYHSFRFVLTNQDDISHRAAVRVEVRNGTGVLEPGREFDLPPGESARFAALVQAPGDAAENTRIEATVMITGDTGATVQANVTLLVTRGVDLPDEAAAFTADPESKSRVVKAQGTSPVPAWLLFLAVLVLARRRR